MLSGNIMNTKDKIMESTFKLLLEKGFLEVSLADIVNESEVGYGSVYYYFEDKDQLIQSVLNKYVSDMFLNQLDKFELSEDLSDNLNEFYKKVLGLNDDYSFISFKGISIDDEVFKKMILLTFEGQQKYEEERDNFQKYIAKFTEVVKEIISKGMENNQVDKNLDIDEVVFNIKSNMYGIFFLWLVQEIDDIESTINTQIKYVMRMLS